MKNGDQLAHRKTDIRFRLVDESGAPLAHRALRVDQVSHQFLFGCGASEAEGMFHARTEEEKKLHEGNAEKWLKLFNYGTLHFYWGRYEHVQGQTDQENMMKAARWLRERNVTLKGHPLCWHTVCADWLLKYSNEEILRLQLDRIRRDVGAFKGLVDLWDVINEVVIMPDFDKYDNAVTRICKEMGRIRLVKAVFEAAHETNPDAVLLINDFNTSVSYEILLEGLLEAGVPIGAIGIQSHQHQGYWGKEKVEQVLERYARFGLPIHFTENTLISGQLMPPHIVDLNDYQVKDWPTTPEGEERQAAQMKEMYTLLFRHPLVQAITGWDFTDRCWLNAPAGLLRKDGSEKPSYHMLNDLIHGEWETHEQAVTDADGCVRLTGFKGDYRVSGDNGEARFTPAEDHVIDLCLTHA